MRKEELGGGLEARKYDLVGKLAKTRTHGHSYRPSSGWGALPVLHVEGAAQWVSRPEKLPPHDTAQHTSSASPGPRLLVHPLDRVPKDQQGLHKCYYRNRR